MKLIWCSGVPEIYGGWGVGMSAMGICAFLCSGVQEIYHQIGRERERARSIHLHSAICEMYVL